MEVVYKQIVPTNVQQCSQELRVHSQVRLVHLDHEPAQKIVLPEQKGSRDQREHILIGIF